MNLEWFFGISAGVLGLILGSAVTALAWRLPRGESWVHGRSRCPSCGHVLGVPDLVPILSWALNRGRCRHCRTRVSVRYPLTEVLCGTWSVLCWRSMGPTPAFPFVLLWGVMLVALMSIDLEVQLLPDVLTYPGAVIAIGVGIWSHGWVHVALGIAVGSGYLLAFLLFWQFVLKRDGMGWGDIKLGVMYGALLGPLNAFVTIVVAAFVGSFAGLVLMLRGRGGMKTALPFGLFLCPAALAAFLWGERAVHAYMAWATGTHLAH